MSQLCPSFFVFLSIINENISYSFCFPSSNLKSAKQIFYPGGIIQARMDYIISNLWEQYDLAIKTKLIKAKWQASLYRAQDYSGTICKHFWKYFIYSNSWAKLFICKGLKVGIWKRKIICLLLPLSLQFGKNKHTFFSFLILFIFILYLVLEKYPSEFQKK